MKSTSLIKGARTTVHPSFPQTIPQPSRISQLQKTCHPSLTNGKSIYVVRSTKLINITFRRTAPSTQRQDSYAGPPQWELEDLVDPSLYNEEYPMQNDAAKPPAPTVIAEPQPRIGTLKGWNQPLTPRYTQCKPQPPQLCIDPKLVDPGFVHVAREWPEEEQETTPSRKRKNPARRATQARGADTGSPKKKARSTPTKPKAGTSKAAVRGSTSPRKKGRK
ncbi:uncharacterized protein BT62DRAFT_1011554 [Guyanagaster necrorhizus]|uniref:Uncharacterized protein n=1 Tax=Guyanagaster necrorhizus TaxID=856835 RepID=A0A9P7VJ60_9AGAR|nr:uncharacterized protein BT62DRAFT_1011554 [Guyanagaster necrorhizus MCA 3950]KAG7441533.1 hypothetical protein BT62DRAFT_1011554 [Guyanagaster necrorhizus MCA 3950]